MPVAYRLVSDAGVNRWKAFDMPWSNLNIRHSAVKITRPRDNPLSLATKNRFTETARANLPTFPSHWSAAQRAKWKASLRSIEVEWSQVQIAGRPRDAAVLRLEWKAPEDTPAAVDWESYCTETLAKLVVPKWKDLGNLFAKATYTVLPVETVDAGQQKGFELVERANTKLEWIQRRDINVSEVRRHPGNSLVLLVDEAASFLNPEAHGGGVANLELFRTFIREAPGLRVFFFTAGSDFSTDLNILSAIVHRVPSELQLNPYLGLNELELPTFTQGKRVTFEDIRAQAGSLLQKGGFDSAALERLRNVSKGLLSVAAATNRDHFAEVINMDPREYTLPLEHAGKLKAMIARASPSSFAHAIVCIDPDNLPPEVLLRNQREYNPTAVMELLVEGGLLPGAKAFLIQLREFDSLRSGNSNKQAFYSTLANDSRAVDLYASVLQAAGYRWVQAKKRTLDRRQWTKKENNSYETRRVDGTLPPEWRSVYLDFQRPLDKHAYGHRYGPLNSANPHDFLVLSESLIVSDTEAIEPGTFGELQQRVSSTGDTDTGFNFQFTLKALRTVLTIPPAPLDQTEEQAQVRADASDAFDTLLRSIKKLHLHLWPGKASAQTITQPSVIAALGNQVLPSFFVMKLVDGSFYPVPLDGFFDIAGLPNEPNARFLALKPILLFNFTMSEYEQRDLLAAITESWNSKANANGASARFLGFGGNYLQGFDLKDSLDSTALHPSRRTDEIQARGRTNRRDGMPNIPFLERRIRHAVLVAKWPGVPATVSDVFPVNEESSDAITMEDSDDEDGRDPNELRYGQMDEELAAVSAVYTVEAKPVPSRALTSESPLQPYEVWRCKSESPSVAAFRQGGDAYLQDFAMDKPFSQLRRDMPSAEDPDSEMPIASWVLAPTQWALKRSALQTYWVSLTEELEQLAEAAREKALDDAESEQQYIARLSDIARQLTPQFDAFDAALKSVILNGLKAQHPQKVVELSEPDSVRELRSRRANLQTLIEVFGERSSIRLLRRLALEPRHRFLLLDVVPRIVVRPSVFNATRQQLLEHLVKSRFSAWNPDIQRIKSQAELASEDALDSGQGSSTVPGSDSGLSSNGYIGGPLVVGACPTPMEIAEARAFTREVRPYSNALEALGILDQEQDGIEEHDGALVAVLSNLRLWRADVEQLSEYDRIELVYKYERQPQLLKDAIIELSKFGLTNWRRALFHLASVYASDRVNGTQSLLFVAQLIGILFYTARDQSFGEAVAYAQNILGDAPLGGLLAYFQLLFQWSSLYSPWDKGELSVVYGLDLSVLLDTIHKFQDRFGLDILSVYDNFTAFKRLIFMTGKTVRPQPLLDIDELAKLYSNSKKTQLLLLPQYTAQWSNRNLRKFYNEFRKNGDYEQARTAALESRGSPLADRYFRLSEIFVDRDPSQFPDPTIKWSTRRLISHILEWEFVDANPDQPYVQKMARVMQTLGISIDELATLLVEVLDLTMTVQENRSRLDEFVDRFQLQATILSRGDEIVFVNRDGQLVILEGLAMRPLEVVSMFQLFQDDPSISVTRSSGFVDDDFIVELIANLQLDEMDGTVDFFYTTEFKNLLVNKNHDQLRDLVEDAKLFSATYALPTSFLLSMLPPGVLADVGTLTGMRQLFLSMELFDTQDLRETFVRTAELLRPLWSSRRELLQTPSLSSELIYGMREYSTNPAARARLDKIYTLGKTLDLTDEEISLALGRGLNQMLQQTTASDAIFEAEQVYTAMIGRLFTVGRKQWFSNLINS